MSVQVRRVNNPEECPFRSEGYRNIFDITDEGYRCSISTKCCKEQLREGNCPLKCTDILVKGEHSGSRTPQLHGNLNLMTLGQYPALTTKDYCNVLGRIFCITLVPIGIAIVSTKMYNHPDMPYIMPPDLLASIHTHLIVTFAVPFLICSAALAAIYITALLCNQPPRELVP